MRGQVFYGGRHGPDRHARRRAETEPWRPFSITRVRKLLLLPVHANSRDGVPFVGRVPVSDEPHEARLAKWEGEVLEPSRHAAAFAAEHGFPGAAVDGDL